MAHADLYYREIINNGKEACSGKNSKNTELTIRFIGAVYDHVFVSKHVPSDGYRTFGKSYDMAVSFQRLLTNQSTKADLVLLRHEHIESAIAVSYTHLNNGEWRYIKKLRICRMLIQKCL